MLVCCMCKGTHGPLSRLVGPYVWGRPNSQPIKCKPTFGVNWTAITLTNKSVHAHTLVESKPYLGMSTTPQVKETKERFEGAV
jgi:hypothetical protein